MEPKWYTAQEIDELPEIQEIDPMVVKPNHYQSKSGLECKDVIEAAVEDLTGYEAVYTANAIKYLWRWKKKNGEQDLQKAKRYIEFLLEKLKG